MWERPSFESLKECINDPSTPIGMRMRAAYYLRQEYTDSKNMDDTNEKEQQQYQQEIINVLSNGLLNREHGSLMRHEFAYVMGQIRDIRCCTTLEYIVQQSDDCVMVRHEAAEALGAINNYKSSIPILQNVLNNKDNELPELLETCEIAINVMEWRMNNNNNENNDNENDMNIPVCACMLNPYNSIDPAPPHPSHNNKSIKELGEIVLNNNNNNLMFERYRAMFSLRNIGTTDAVLELCNVLLNDNTSVLLRHEIAYILGQLQHPNSIYALEEILHRKQNEHCMVRHEAAEALGAVLENVTTLDEQQYVENILHTFSNIDNENDIVVRESCLVALDAADYWNNNNNQTNNNNNNNDISDEKEQDIVEKETDNKQQEQQQNNNDTTFTSFAKQKAVTTKNQQQQVDEQTKTTNYSTTQQQPKGVLVNHFNVVK